MKMNNNDKVDCIMAVSIAAFGIAALVALVKIAEVAASISK